jgi:endoglucanase
VKQTMSDIQAIKESSLAQVQAPEFSTRDSNADPVPLSVRIGYGVQEQTTNTATDDKPARLHGVSIAGAEFTPNVLPGKPLQDYIFPTTQELDYYKQKGMDLIRVPFLWERMQPGLINKNNPNASVDRSFDPEYAKQMENLLVQTDQRGLKVVLDAHDYGRYNWQVVGASNITNDDFKQFWAQMAKNYGQHPSVYGYDISNEPNSEDNKTWHDAAQAAVDGIRTAGDRHAVIVEGNQWAGAQSWEQVNNDLSVQDPANNTIYSAHSYWDSDHSGTYGGGNGAGSFDRAVADARNQRILGPDEDPTNLGVNNARPFVEWLKKHNAKGFIGEYGVPANDPNWVKTQDKFLAYTRANNVDTAAWGAGPWWGSDYVMTLETGPKGELSTSGPEPLNMKSVARDGVGV